MGSVEILPVSSSMVHFAAVLTGSVVDAARIWSKSYGSWTTQRTQPKQTKANREDEATPAVSPAPTTLVNPTGSIGVPIKSGMIKPGIKMAAT